MDIVLVSHPDHVKHVLLKHPDLPSSMTDVIFREGPRFHAMANGEEWRRVKKALTPKFTQRGLEPLRQTINDAIASFPDLNLGMTVSMFASDLPDWIPRPFDRRFNAAKDDILSHIDAMVAQRRRTGLDSDDLLSMVLNARFEDGTAMSEEQIRRGLLGLMFAGYDTTATAMSWVLALMPSAPEAQARANKEADALGGMPGSLEDQKRLTWLRACFEEAQRLQGVLFMRETRVDEQLGEFLVPAGTNVIVSGRGLQRDLRWWRDADRFDPSRFLEDDINRYAFMVFAAGPPGRRAAGLPGRTDGLHGRDLDARCHVPALPIRAAARMAPSRSIPHRHRRQGRGPDGDPVALTAPEQRRSEARKRWVP